jgi:hypothetical protein
VTVHGLRVGEATVSLRFERNRDGSTSVDVFEKKGTLVVTEVAPPQEVDSDRTFAENAKTWLLERAPGRLALAMRLGLGDDDAL